MSKRFAGNPRTLNPDGIIHNGEVGVVESPGPSQAYIPSNAISGNQFRLLNTSNHDVILGVESNAFEIELVDADPQASIIIPPGSMFFGVTGWSTVHSTFQLFATVTSAVDDGPGPGPGPEGDWLPKDNPIFTGVMTGEEFASEYGFVFRDEEELSVEMNSSTFSVEGTNSVNFNVTGTIAGDGNSVRFRAADYISLEADGPEEGVELMARNGSIDINAKDISLRTSDGANYFEMNDSVISMSNSDGAEFTQFQLTGNRVSLGSVQPTGTAGLEAGPDGARLTMPVGVPGIPDNMIEVNGTGVVISTNPTLSGTIATAELSDMALITKGQIWDVLNGVYNGLKNDDLIPGPARATGQFVRLPQSLELGTPDTDMHFTGLCVEQCDISVSGGAVIVFNHLAGNRPTAVLSTGHWRFTFQAARTGDLPTVPTWYID